MIKRYACKSTGINLNDALASFLILYISRKYRDPKTKLYVCLKNFRAKQANDHNNM